MVTNGTPSDSIRRQARPALTLIVTCSTSPSVTARKGSRLTNWVSPASR